MGARRAAPPPVANTATGAARCPSRTYPDHREGVGQIREVRRDHVQHIGAAGHEPMGDVLVDGATGARPPERPFPAREISSRPARNGSASRRRSPARSGRLPVCPGLMNAGAWHLHLAAVGMAGDGHGSRAGREPGKRARVVQEHQPWGSLGDGFERLARSVSAPRRRPQTDDMKGCAGLFCRGCRHRPLDLDDPRLDKYAPGQ